MEGNKLKDPSGNTVILRGVAIEGLTAQSQTPLGINGILDKITNKDDTAGSSTGWYTKIVRLPVDPPGTSDTYVNNILKPAVDYATTLGLYAIIDLHYIANPYSLTDAVNAFWTKVAPMFKDYSNVFYEVFNESNQTDSWATYKPTMQAWVNLIRGFAPNNIILAGSPQWNQSLGDAAASPLAGGNIVYVVHMYEQQYDQGLGPTVQQVEAAAAVNPVMMTEWGYCHCSGQPGEGTDIGASYGTPMLTWLEAMGGSWTAWCASLNWLPAMFSGNGSNWTLRVGQDEMGGFVKDWLYAKRNE